jgi:hypothetical protein
VGSATPRPDRTCSGNGAKTLSAWFDTSCFTTAALQADLLAGNYRYGNSGRNILSGPGSNDWDFAALKHFQLSERFKLEFRAELFNMWNTPNFAYPHTNVDAASFGVINNTSGAAREVQFGLKLSF